MKDLRNSNPSGYTSTICFHAQKAVEKYLKAFLAFHDIDFPRTQDVDYLLMECQKIDSESFNLDLKSLTEFGAFDDSRGLKYLTLEYYIKIQDYNGGLNYTRWFQRNFPDDIGFPEFLFEWTNLQYRVYE